MTISFLDRNLAGKIIPLKQRGSLPERVHVLDLDSIKAVNAALAAKRPLLIRGEPGIGKSQLARAVAKQLKRVFVQHVIDAHCESQDLLWHFDAVQRLADAQLGNAAGWTPEQMREQLQLCNYLHPGPLWWAFNWDSAATQAKKLQLPTPEQEHDCDAKNGCVLLIDEIDKAEMDVPNGLLEALGEGCFTPKGWPQAIAANKIPPLVIITTNEERALPNAFLRRCLVLHLTLASKDKDLLTVLVERGKAHFPNMQTKVLDKAAEMLRADRQHAEDKQLQPLPGLAEYLDLLRAVQEQASDSETQIELLNEVAQFVVRKHSGSESS